MTGRPRWVLVAAIVLVAANLRTLMASLPPLAEAVRADLGLSSAWMGVLTTLPTPRDSARLTAMAFLVSYTVAAFGPAAMGVVEDVTGSFSPIWALLALTMVPQIILSLRLRSDRAPVGTRLD